MKHRVGLYGFLVWLAVGCNFTQPNLPAPAPQTEPTPEEVIPGSKLPEKINTTNGTGEPGGTGGPEIPTPFDGTSPMPVSLCGTGSHFSFLSISPDPNVALVAGMPMTIQARVQYSLPPNTDDAIGFAVRSADVNVWEDLYETPVSQYTQISSGAAGACDTVDLTLPLTVTGATTFQVAIVSANLGVQIGSFVIYRFDDVPYIRVTGVAPAMNQLLFPDARSGSVSISLEWDMKGHEVYPQFSYIAYDFSNGLGFSYGYLDYPDLFTSPVGSGTFTYDYALDTESCHQELWVIFEVDDVTSGITSDLAAAHWYFRPLPFALSNDSYGPIYAQPGAGPQAGGLFFENCMPEDLTMQIASDSSWLTLSAPSLVVPGGSSAWLEYAVDATGLTPNTDHQGTVSATAVETGDSASTRIDLWVGDYYVPCAPQILLTNYYDFLDAQPGAPVQTYYLYLENCSLATQTLIASSNVPWLLVSSSPILVYANEWTVLEFSVDATGLTPASVELGTLTVGSSETGANAETTIELTVGDYYVPPPPYNATATPFSWNPAADTGNGSLAMGSGTDDSAFALTLPFPITFYGTSFTQATICANGGIMFGVRVAYCTLGISLPSMEIGTALSMNWGDLYVGTNGSIRYATTGISPNRTFVISFNSVGLCCSATGNASTFQAVFTEGSEVFKVQYGTLSYEFVGGTNYGDGYSAISWAPASNSAYTVSPQTP